MFTSQEQAIYPGSELFLIKRFMHEKAIQDAAWLMGTGLHAEDLKNPALRVSLHQFDTVYRNVYRLCPSPSLGLELGKQLNLSRWGVLAMALQSSKHLGDALATARDYRMLLRSRFQLATITTEKTVETEILPNLDMSFPVNETFAMEMLISSLLRLVKDLAGPDAGFKRIQCRYPEPRHGHLYESFLNCPVAFSQPRSAIVMETTQMLQPLPLANLVSKRQALVLCENDLQRLEHTLKQDCAAQVMQVLTDTESEHWTLPKVAKTLAMSERNLRRKLYLQGKEFRLLKQQRQMQLAMELLLKRHSVSWIAQQCGFKDLSSFRTRFKSTTGLTPRQFIQQHSLH